VEDLKEFLGACIVVRHPHGEEEVEWTSLEKHEEETVLYTSDTHVVDGKTCNVTVTGGFNSGMMGADPELTGWGRSGGVWVWVQCVWEGQLKELVCEVGFADMQRAGYKGGWDLMDDNGFLYWKMEHRHVSRLLKNLVFRWEGGDEEAKGDVALKWIGGRPAIYKNAGGYVGGEFCFSSFFFEKPGVLKVRCMKAAGGGDRGRDGNQRARAGHCGVAGACAEHRQQQRGRLEELPRGALLGVGGGGGGGGGGRQGGAQAQEERVRRRRMR
jgi:hypothetical protein